MLKNDNHILISYFEINFYCNRIFNSYLTPRTVDYEKKKFQRKSLACCPSAKIRYLRTPRRWMASSNIFTASWPTPSGHAKLLVHVTSTPLLRPSWIIGNEKVNPKRRNPHGLHAGPVNEIFLIQFRGHKNVKIDRLACKEVSIYLSGENGTWFVPSGKWWSSMFSSLRNLKILSARWSKTCNMHPPKTEFGSIAGVNYVLI